MYPHERSLVKRLADEPFALIGINSDDVSTDENMKTLRDRMKEENMTWRSFRDGSTGGPIATSWNIQGWPTIYVLDADGVIRYKDVRGEAMDHAVDQLLDEMKEGD